MLTLCPSEPHPSPPCLQATPATLSLHSPTPVLLAMNLPLPAGAGIGADTAESEQAPEPAWGWLHRFKARLEFHYESSCNWL